MTDTTSLRSAAEALLAAFDYAGTRLVGAEFQAKEALRAALDSPPGPLAAELERLADECERGIPMHLSHYSVTESNGRVRAYRHAARLAREHEATGFGSLPTEPNWGGHDEETPSASAIRDAASIVAARPAVKASAMGGVAIVWQGDGIRVVLELRNDGGAACVVRRGGRRLLIASAREHEGGGLRWSAEEPDAPGLWLCRVYFLDRNGEPASAVELVTLEAAEDCPLNEHCKREWAGPVLVHSEETP